MRQLLAVASSVALGLLGGATRADEPHHTCTIRVIHAGEPIGATATAQPPSIDPRIDRLRPYLLQPPFTAWREFKLLDARTLELQPKVPSSFSLPNGRTVTLTFLEHLPDTGKTHHRVRLQLEMTGSHKAPDGTPLSSLKTIIVVEEGGLVLQAGQPHRHGMLVVGTSCTEAGH